MAKNTVAVITMAIVGAIALAGCVPTQPTPVPSSASTQSAAESPAPTPTATEPAVPVLVEGGTAAENKPYFDLVNQAFLVAHGKGTGQLIIDNLVAAGFSKQDMELTADRTSIDLEADSIFFSVRMKGECLVGALRVSTYSSTVGPLLGTGSCLVGTTRPIDW